MTSRGGTPGSAPDHASHPAWYGAVMGTGALALAVSAQAATWGWSRLTPMAVALLLLASVLSVVLLPRYVRRAHDRPALRTELGDASHGPMLGTLPAGLLVLAVGWGRIGPDLVPTGLALTVSATLLVVGTVLALALGLVWASGIVTTTPGLEGVNGGWLIPPVMTLLVPLALAPLITAKPAAAPLLLLLGFAFLGVGVLLFLTVLTLFVARLALREPMPAAMAPSMWIPLAPAGILGLATLRLFQSGEAAAVAGFTSATAGLVVAAMGIGFGLWWPIYRRKGIEFRQALGVALRPEGDGRAIPAPTWTSPTRTRRARAKRNASPTTT